MPRSFMLSLIVSMSAFMMLSGVTQARTIEGCLTKAEAICVEDSLSGQSLMSTNTPDAKLNFIDLPGASLTSAAPSSLSSEVKQVIAPLNAFNKANQLSKAEKKKAIKEYKRAEKTSFKCAQKIWAEPKTKARAKKIGGRAKSLFYGAWSDNFLNERFLLWFHKKRTSLDKTAKALSALSLADQKMQQAAAVKESQLSLMLQTFSSKPAAGIGCSSLRILRQQDKWNSESARLSFELQYGLSQEEVNEYNSKNNKVQQEVQQGAEDLQEAGASKQDILVYQYFPVGAWLTSFN